MSWGVSSFVYMGGSVWLLHLDNRVLFLWIGNKLCCCCLNENKNTFCLLLTWGSFLSIPIICRSFHSIQISWMFYSWVCVCTYFKKFLDMYFFFNILLLILSLSLAALCERGFPLSFLIDFWVFLIKVLFQFRISAENCFINFYFYILSCFYDLTQLFSVSSFRNLLIPSEFLNPLVISILKSLSWDKLLVSGNIMWECWILEETY